MHSSGVVESGHAMSTTKPARPQAQLASVVVQPASPSPMTPLTPGGGHALFMNMSHGPQLVPSPTIMSEISQGVTVIELARRSHDRPAPQQTSVINMVSGGMTSPQPMSLSPTSNRMAFNVQNKGRHELEQCIYIPLGVCDLWMWVIAGIKFIPFFD